MERDNESKNNDDISSRTDKRYEVRTLLSWSAPGRPFKKRSRIFYINILLIMLLVCVILFLFSQYLLMLVVVSLVFVTYALTSVPPHDFQYKVSTEGIRVEDHFYLWEELYDFYFKKNQGVDILHLRARALFPGELTITLGEITPDQIKSVLLHFLPYREYIKPTFVEKSSDWLSKNFTLEKNTAKRKSPKFASE